MYRNVPENMRIRRALLRTKLPTIYESFDDNLISPTRWTKFFTPAPSTAKVAENGSRLETTHTPDAAGVANAFLITTDPIDVTEISMYFGMQCDAAGVMQLRTDFPTLVGDPLSVVPVNAYYAQFGATNALVRYFNSVGTSLGGLDLGTNPVALEITVSSNAIHFNNVGFATTRSDTIPFSSRLWYLLLGMRCAQGFTANDFFNEILIGRNMQKWS